MKNSNLFTILLSSTFLVACGGGGGDANNNKGKSSLEHNKDIAKEAEQLKKEGNEADQALKALKDAAQNDKNTHPKVQEALTALSDSMKKYEDYVVKRDQLLLDAKSMAEALGFTEKEADIAKEIVTYVSNAAQIHEEITTKVAAYRAAINENSGEKNEDILAAAAKFDTEDQEKLNEAQDLKVKIEAKIQSASKAKAFIESPKNEIDEEGKKMGETAFNLGFHLAPSLRKGGSSVKFNLSRSIDQRSYGVLIQNTDSILVDNFKGTTAEVVNKLRQIYLPKIYLVDSGMTGANIGKSTLPFATLEAHIQSENLGKEAELQFLKAYIIGMSGDIVKMNPTLAQYNAISKAINEALLHVLKEHPTTFGFFLKDDPAKFMVNDDGSIVPRSAAGEEQLNLFSAAIQKTPEDLSSKRGPLTSAAMRQGDAGSIDLRESFGQKFDLKLPLHVRVVGDTNLKETSNTLGSVFYKAGGALFGVAQAYANQGNAFDVGGKQLETSAVSTFTLGNAFAEFQSGIVSADKVSGSNWSGSRQAMFLGVDMAGGISPFLQVSARQLSQENGVNHKESGAYVGTTVDRTKTNAFFNLTSLMTVKSGLVSDKASKGQHSLTASSFDHSVHMEQGFGSEGVSFNTSVGLSTKQNTNLKVAVGFSQ